jgi:hypothetical protein
VSTTFREVDETVESDLFERRARALGTPAGVPSLEAVLRAANDEASLAVPVPMRAARDPGSRRHAWSGLALAAACVVAVMRAAPQPGGAPATIAADFTRDVRAPSVVSAVSAGSDSCEEAEVNACTLDSAYASSTPVAPPPPIAGQDHACTAPLATFESSTLSCDRDEANRSEMP